MYYNTYMLLRIGCKYYVPAEDSGQLRGPKDVETIADKSHNRLISVSGFIL